MKYESTKIVSFTFFLFLVLRACTAPRLDYQPLFGKGACAPSLKAQNKFLLGGETKTGQERAVKSTTVDEVHVCHEEHVCHFL